MSNPEKLKKWVEFSKNPKLVYSQKVTKKAIDYCVKLEKKNAELVELVEQYRKYLILEYKRNSVPRHDPEKSYLIMQLDEKLNKIKGDK